MGLCPRRGSPRHLRRRDRVWTRLDIPQGGQPDLLGGVRASWLDVTDLSAVRMRFNIPLSMPTTNVSAPQPASKSAAQAALGRRRSLQTLEFDPLVVAKHGDNWDTSLRTVIVAWVTEAAREVRDRVVTPESGDSTAEEKAHEKAEEKAEKAAEEAEEKTEAAETEETAEGGATEE